MAITFDVERFEHVTATPETALLRVSGRWVSARRERLSPPMLVVDDGRRTHRLAALPGPEDAAPLAGPDSPGWRAAFSAPVALMEGRGTAFALDAGRGALVDLPHPVAGRRERRPPAEPEAVQALDEEALGRSRAEAGRRARARREAMRALEDLLAAERDARIEADRLAAHEAAARERLEGEASRRERRLESLGAALAPAQAQRRDAERIAASRSEELREARERLEGYIAAERTLTAELDAARA